MAPVLHKESTMKIFLQSKNIYVRLTGYIKAPITDRYRFVIDSDGATEITVSGKILIDNYMTDNEKGYKKA